MQMQPPPQQPQQPDLNQPITLTLPLGVWNTVVAMIAKQPWEMADPLIQEIRRQAGSQVLPPGGNVVPMQPPPPAAEKPAGD